MSLWLRESERGGARTDSAERTGEGPVLRLLATPRKLLSDWHTVMFFEDRNMVDELMRSTVRCLVSGVRQTEL